MHKCSQQDVVQPQVGSGDVNIHWDQELLTSLAGDSACVYAEAQAPLLSGCVTRWVELYWVPAELL